MTLWFKFLETWDYFPVVSDVATARLSQKKVLRLPSSGAWTPLSLHCLYAFRDRTNQRKATLPLASTLLPSVYDQGAFLTLWTWWHLNQNNSWSFASGNGLKHTLLLLWKGLQWLLGPTSNTSLGISSHFLWKRLDGQKNIPWCILVFKEIIPQPGWLLVSSASLDPSHETKSDRSREPCPVRYGPGMDGKGGGVCRPTCTHANLENPFSSRLNLQIH